MTDVAKRKAFNTATPGAFVVVVLISSWFFFGPHPRAAIRDAGDFGDTGSIVGRSFVGRFFYSLFAWPLWSPSRAASVTIGKIVRRLMSQALNASRKLLCAGHGKLPRFWELAYTFMLHSGC
jgi:hypothetical protein